MKPRVLHISTAKDKRGGEQQLMYLLGDHQSQVDQHVLCIPDSPVHAYCVQHTIASSTQGKRSGLDLALAKSLAQNANMLQSQLVHSHDAHGHSAAVMAKRFFGMQADIVAHRRVDFHIHSSFSKRFKYAYKGVKKIICVSKAIEQIMASDLGSSSKLTTIHDGIDVSAINTADNGELRKRFSIDPSKKIIGQVAAHAPHKDLFTFIQTAKELCAQRNDLHFISIGDGPQSAEIRSYCTSQNMDEHITFTGYLEKAKQLIAEFDVFFMSSETEGLGTSILDAMAAGIPVVATQAGGIPEVVEHGISGRLAPVKDSRSLALNLAKALSEDNGSMIKAARKKLQFFTTKVMSEKTLKLYQEILLK